ncbi:MAG: type I restriction enzyme HsdR N-terminal domain-containing protein [Coriobacteriia bacterium]|jgi:hypothetical protein|nr:type I restriction enzyme HsdR N-terminal domain-containing protein [Coriobacteriia bacterium]
MSLEAHVADVREGVRSGRFNNEAAVSQGIVLRLLQALGWPTFDTQVVSPEYALEGRRVDYALCNPPGRPAVFVEVKQIGQSDGAERQLFEYAFHTGVPMAILTDGPEWSFFLPAEQGDYRDRRVYKLDLIEREVDEVVTRLRRYLDFEAVRSGAALQAARDDYQNVSRARLIERALPEALNRLVLEEDPLLIELLADQVESLCGYKPEPDTVAVYLRDRLVHGAAVAESVTPAAQPHSRRSAASSSPTTGIGFTLDGESRDCRNGREVLVSVFESLTRRDPAFPERFAALPRHGRTRRYLARVPDDLYPGRPDLAHEYSAQLSGGWWLGVNYSKAQIERIVRLACDVAGLRYGRDLVVRLGS